MLTINAHTKISALIKANPNAIDAIASINPHFKKLQNPLLRKMLASRVTISDAARIGKCAVEDFYKILLPLGFEVDDKQDNRKPTIETNSDKQLQYDQQLDVRADIEAGNDPFKKIMAQLATLNDGETLLLINSFEPTPLIRILSEKGYTTEVVTIAANEVHTYFHKKAEATPIATINEGNEQLFAEKEREYQTRLRTIDVRSLPMPQPMMTIMKELETLPEEMALFAHHKRVPMFLLPELKSRNFATVFKPADDGIKMIIYKA